MGAAQLVEADVLRVPGARRCALPRFADARGVLTVAEAGTQVPFVPRRMFAITDVPDGQVRGQHAHRAQGQFFLCLRGRVALELENRRDHDALVLEAGGDGLYVPPMIWVTLRPESADTVLVVLVSDVFDESDYIRDRGEYLRLVHA